MNYITSIVLLLVLIGILVLGLYHSHYEDNLGQCIGIVFVIIWAIATVDKNMSLHFAATSDTFVSMGLLIFAVGTGVRTWLYKRKRG